MCQSHNPRRIDPCMRKLINFLNQCHITQSISMETVGCCCGHGRYPMTILVKHQAPNEQFLITEICSATIIPRSKRFYVKDKDGYFYIPETLKVPKEAKV